LSRPGLLRRTGIREPESLQGTEVKAHDSYPCHDDEGKPQKGDRHSFLTTEMLVRARSADTRTRQRTWRARLPRPNTSIRKGDRSSCATAVGPHGIGAGAGTPSLSVHGASAGITD